MSYREEYEKWCAAPCLTAAEKQELEAVRNDAGEIESRFYANLEFGTAGLRGIMGMGTNRMNLYVIRHATQAFAQVVLEAGEDAQRGVGVCYDCRNQSDVFAREAACVMAANGIPVFLFDEMRPTPELSFAIRHYGYIAGINITASHNPKEYNGYKVYWEDGAQLPPDHAAKVAANMTKLDVFRDIVTMDFDTAVAEGKIRYLGAETDEAFLGKVMGQINDQKAVDDAADSFTMVYTPFHGTGRKLIPEVLRRLGVKHLYCEPQQMIPDGNFSTVVSPNPENPEGFYLAVALAKEKGADFILGSDPDADRVGIMVRGKDGEFHVLTGNQTGVLMLDYLIGAKKRTGKLPAHPAFVKSIVTTEMGRRVAEANGVGAFDAFTGFKFLAERKNKLEEKGEWEVLMSYEESYGYMLGDYVRDKDAVTASLVLTEMAAWYAGQGMTLMDALEKCFEKYGWHGEKTLNLVMPGLSGLAKMREIMAGLRQRPLTEISGVKVLRRRDYLPGTEECVESGEITEMELRDSNVLSYMLEDGTTVVVRPSGTEPKIKIYILAAGASKADCDEKVQKFAVWAETLKS